MWEPYFFEWEGRLREAQVFSRAEERRGTEFPVAEPARGTTSE